MLAPALFRPAEPLPSVLLPLVGLELPFQLQPSLHLGVKAVINEQEQHNRFNLLCVLTSK